MSLVLFLIRHATAQGNRNHILNGNRIDAQLTKKGRKQAKQLVNLIKQKPDIILSSPLKRARQTAYYFEKKYSLKAQIIEDLQEQDFGEWSGLDADKLKKIYPKNFFSYPNKEKSNFLISCPGGESYSALKKRAKKVLDFIKKNFKNKIVFAFSHGVLILAMIEIVTKIKPPKLLNLQLKNASWVCFIFDD